ncbi:DMT family transporter [Alcanivorax jadensis]|uniref:DMT family transporter n=1 Tax=Alcanivorax jadensis TaxID=64988 RepID=UPI0026EA5E05|nr:DMT family transporter [Alcanivorax jadensis]
MIITRDTRFLLLASGMLLGFTFPLAKLAGIAQMPAMTWVILNSLGASLTLLTLLMLTGGLELPRGRQWRYALITGPITFASPSLLVFLVVPQVGAGYSGIMFALSPVLTLTLTRLAGMGTLGRQKTLGLLLGLGGAAGISLTRGSLGAPAEALWLALAALIPLALAAGNLYRTLDWPGQASPELLAFWSHTLAVILYASAALIFGNEAIWKSAVDNPQLAAGHLALAGLIAPLIFRLQRFGGPVLLSQTGYVAAGTSLLIASVWMRESYPLTAWLSALVILVGMVISLWPKASKPVICQDA